VPHTFCCAPAIRNLGGTCPRQLYGAGAYAVGICKGVTVLLWSSIFYAYNAKSKVTFMHSLCLSFNSVIRICFLMLKMSDEYNNLCNGINLTALMIALRALGQLVGLSTGA